MKKGFTASIIVLILGIATIILNALLTIIFMIAVDLATSLGGSSASTGESSMMIILLLIAIFLALINVVLSISAMINFKLKKENGRIIKKLLIWFLSILVISVVCNVILMILTWGYLGVIMFIIPAIIYVVCIILIIFQIKAINLNLYDTKNIVNM